MTCHHIYTGAVVSELGLTKMTNLQTGFTDARTLFLIFFFVLDIFFMIWLWIGPTVVVAVFSLQVIAFYAQPLTGMRKLRFGNGTL